MPHRSTPILLVEDDLSLSGSLSGFLTDHGYRTIACATARQGWDLMNSARPRLCLLDLNLPDGSGLDLLRRVAQARLPVQVIVMTAFDLHHMRPTDANGHLVGWMTKPVNPFELLAAVESALKPAAVAQGK